MAGTLKHALLAFFLLGDQNISERSGFRELFADMECPGVRSAGAPIVR